MPMLRDPTRKYTKPKPFQLPCRTWPDKTIDQPPRWLSTDLRDGNQSLVDPMNCQQKLRYFQMLVKLGYKEIEVAFPSASQTDFDFTRNLVQTPGIVPDDVWIQVLSPCRKDLIRRTVDSLKGAKKAILNLYLASSACFQQIVFNMTEEETKALAVECTTYARELTKDNPDHEGTEWVFEFTPEHFSDSSLDFTIELCEAVKDAWEPSIQRPIILNLPATVELTTPNVYADQIEYFCRNISEREKICVSLHPHNDRGCAVAAAEQAQMAGADRVEGTLFGNGERTGNVDLVTLSLNLYTQGIFPGIDFSDIRSVIDMVETCTKIPIHPRTPYGGQLVVCAFSGSHQDAIKKGFTKRFRERSSEDDRWSVPYLPFDPEDIGRTYEAVIRVNSQSGKSGVAWIIQRHLQLVLPRDLQIAFSKFVQIHAEKLGRELQPEEVVTLFEDTYFLAGNPRYSLTKYEITPGRSDSPTLGPKPCSTLSAMINVDGKEHMIHGSGSSIIACAVDAMKELGIKVDIVDHTEHTTSKAKDTARVVYLRCRVVASDTTLWGVGIDHDANKASLIALLNAASSITRKE